LDFGSSREALIDLVERVIEDAIQHLKISLKLPKIIQNPKLAARLLAGSGHDQAIELVKNFHRRRDIILKEERNPLMDHGMIMLIDYFQSHRDIYKRFKGYFDTLSSKEMKLLSAFEMLLESAKRHLNRTAHVHIREERRLTKIYQENKKLKKNIKTFRLRLSQLRSSMRFKLLTQGAHYDSLMQEWRQQKLETERIIEIETEKIQRGLRVQEKLCLENENQIEQQVNVAQNQYNALIKETRITEKRTREEKNKLLLQLQSIIKKYDTTISEKIIENLDLEDQLKEAQKKLDKFMVTYRNEEKIYNEVVVKRELREERERREIITSYMMNRAASKIQRYWKKWRKALKAKSKRSRGKRKQN
ncbi:hypothetical protein KR093_007356, partial [Drosophila rubida]